MSVSVEISYEQDVELMAITGRLSDLPLKVSRKPYHKPGARFKRVYLKGETLRPQAPGSASEGRCNASEDAGKPNT